MGHDWWPYGYEPNRITLDTFLRYHHEQGLSKRRLTPEELERMVDFTFQLARSPKETP